MDHLFEFAAGVYDAHKLSDLDGAAEHLAKAIAILGIQAVLAVLFRGAKAKAPRTRRIDVEPPPPSTPGFKYRPTVKKDPSLPAGEGATSSWGDIVISSRGSAAEQSLVLLHEKVHAFLTPTIYFLRKFRVESRTGSYFQSSLWRYIEEALAETIAQVGVNGIKQFFTGIRFPVENGYVYLTRAGGEAKYFAGNGVVRETLGLIYQGMVSGITWNLFFQPSPPTTDKR
jgi:hypothetical protein